MKCALGIISSGAPEGLGVGLVGLGEAGDIRVDVHGAVDLQEIPAVQQLVRLMAQVQRLAQPIVRVYDVLHAPAHMHLESTKL